MLSLRFCLACKVFRRQNLYKRFVLELFAKSPTTELFAQPAKCRRLSPADMD